MDYVNVPTTVFTPLEYGTVGYSEEQAKENEETALVPMETEEKDAPEFEYATGVANNEMYQRRSPTPPPEPEKTTEELQEELQNDLKARALKSMKKRKLAKLKAQAQAVEESSSDDDSDEESEKAAATGEGGAEGEEAPNYRSGYGSGDEKK